MTHTPMGGPLSLTTSQPLKAADLGDPPVLDPADDLCTYCDEPAENHVLDGRLVSLREFHRAELPGTYGDELLDAHAVEKPADHTPYIAAVAKALTAAGLSVLGWEALDDEYREAWIELARITDHTHPMLTWHEREGWQHGWSDPDHAERGIDCLADLKVDHLVAHPSAIAAAVLAYYRPVPDDIDEALTCATNVFEAGGTDRDALTLIQEALSLPYAPTMGEAEKRARLMDDRLMATTVFLETYLDDPDTYMQRVRLKVFHQTVAAFAPVNYVTSSQAQERLAAGDGWMEAVSPTGRPPRTCPYCEEECSHSDEYRDRMFEAEGL